MIITHLLSIDPGGQHTGIVLAEAAASGPPKVIDGITLDRRPSEADRRITGLPAYADRYIECVAEMLDKHGVAVESLLVFVEGHTPTQVHSDSSATELAHALKITADKAGLIAILGATAALFPKQMRWEVPPDHHDAKGKLIAPPELHDRTPKGWMRDGTDRSHQCAAYSVMIDGVKAVQKWRPGLLPGMDLSGGAGAAVTESVGELVDFDEPGEPLTEDLSARVAASVREAGHVTPTTIAEAAQRALADDSADKQLDLAWAAALLLQPATNDLPEDDKAELRERLRSRLLAS